MEMELAEKSGGEPLLGRLSKTHGATISFHNICYKVRLDQNKSWSQCSCNHGNTGTAKTVLTDLNGIMKPGLNAIMGPTGSGKTSFLDVLAGRKDPSGVSGEVLIDGAPQPPNFKILSGYVVQEDVVMGYLTVRQNLLFSALLRLPSSLSLKERNDKVERIIQELGLGLVADSNVGTEFIRGISGGEKKRLNIGMELIIDPSVLFLDEPTTGLDASTANSVLLLLKTMAKKGHTIILSIHQPRYSIYKLFDNLTLLVNGKQVYHGPAKEALSYFSGIGYTCEPHNNPADFFLDVINGDSTAVALDSSTNNGEDFELVQSPKRGVIAEQLVEEYKNSSYFRHTQDELERLSDQKEFATVESGNITYNSGFFTQFFWIFIRSVWSFAVTNRTHFMRVPISLAMQRLCMMIYLSTFIGALFYDAPNDQKGIQNRFGAFFVATVNLVFGSISSAEFFISERKQYNHEYISGYYSVSAYFVAKVLADLVALRILPVFAFLILYFMIGLKITTEAISLFLGTLVLVSFTGSSATLAIGIAENTVAAATQNVTLFFLAMMLFAGLLVNLTSVPGWLIWMKYLSIPQYGCAALQINEFVGLNFTVNWNKTVFNRTGEQILEEQGVDHSPLGLWQNHLALTAMIMVSLFIAFGKLRLKKPYA